MSNETQVSNTQKPAAAMSEEERIESASADIEGLCGHVFCESLFMRVEPGLMALACERHPKVQDWWESMVEMGHPKAPVVWAQIKAQMDARAAMRAIEDVMTSA